MNNAKHTRRALLSSVVALVLCLTMLMGTTFAWFTDTATVKVNTIQSGTLDIDLVDAAGKSVVGEPLTFVTKDGREAENILWEPGCTYKLNDVFVKNNGNLAVKYQVVITGIGGDAKLNEAIEWTISYADNGTDGGEIVVDSNGTGEYFLLPGKTSGAISISGHMDEEANNDYQNLKIDNIAITVNATQWTYEYDSTVNTYDANAEYDIPKPITNDELLAEAIEKGEDYTVSTGNFSKVVVADGINVVINGADLYPPYSNPISVKNGGTVVIENATISEKNGQSPSTIAMVTNNGTLTIKGGTYMTGSIVMGDSTGKVIIEGGKFDGMFINGFGEMLDTVGSLTITGGTFSNVYNKTTLEQYIADGYTAKLVDGWYVVEPIA